jgi:glutamate synthase (NADPH/NADH) small chain
MKELLLEANRCIMCKKPRCREHCPIDTPIPEAIALFKEGKMAEAGEMLFKNNPLTQVCGVVCPHEDQCKGNCIRGIKSEPVKFCEIEEYVSRVYIENTKLEKEADIDKMVAVVGGGPAGITVAFILAQKGYKVTIFEANPKLGGLLRYGIPEFRLPKDIIDTYEERLIELGVSIRPNTLIGPVVTLDRLFEDGYKAVFIGTGVWNPRVLNIKGESLGNVHYAIDYLKTPETYRIGERVIVIGAGDVGMDAARTAKRNGAKDVRILHLKGMDEITATKAEFEGALEDGVEIETYKAPMELTLKGIKYKETRSEKGEEPKEGFLECDTIIIAISQAPKNNIVANTTGLQTDDRGHILADEEGKTTREGVFSAGDVVIGAATVVKAVAKAKVVAEAMDEYMKTIE